MATLKDFRAWWDRDLGRYAPWQSSVQVITDAVTSDIQELNIRIFTDRNRYSITVREPQPHTVRDPNECQYHYEKKPTIADIEALMQRKDRIVEIAPDGSISVFNAVEQLDGGYLGCISCSRRWRAGEEHHRGSDLKDGPFTEERWHAIVADMLAYELVLIDRDLRTPVAPPSLVPQDSNVPATASIEANGSANSLGS